jgi:hypothetical protein
MTNLSDHENSCSENSIGQCSPSLDPILRSLQSTLAAMDEEYKRERAKVTSDPRHGNLKSHILRKLEQRYQERRLPYVLQLESLNDRMSVSP